jgi:hypothetical protein
MTHPINYYIALSEEFSTAIDAMSKEELIELATKALMRYDTFKTFDDMYRVAITINKRTLYMTRNQYPILAHGLLAKAV